ncbi:MAG: RsmE family RNA methyltransferase [Selenomonadaceae bacterium]|nr:RsmE family RNA methyltransferase [Selenomonadaceae bacterium]
MRRLFTKEKISDTLTLTGTDAHHVGYALRGKVGDKYTVVDDYGTVAIMEAAAFREEEVDLRLVEYADGSAATESPINITLAACLIKGEKFEFVVQKAVELGVNRLIPLISDNTVVKLDEKKAAARRERWQKIADEAAKQCGRTRLMAVEEVKPLKKWLAVGAKAELDDGTVGVFAYENEANLSIGRFLAGKLQEENMPEKFMALVGPEGGFTQAEAQTAVEAGFNSVTMGPRIFRAETAALTVAAVIQYQCGDIGSLT